MANWSILTLLACLCIHYLFISVEGANLPTLTISKLAATNTIRFPDETSTVRTSLLVSEPSRPTSTSTTSTIRPSKSENVHIIGNYSIAVQQVKSIQKENDEVEEIIEKTSSLLELLDFWRKLPRERLAEIYPHVLGQGGRDGHDGTAQTSTLELLNKLRQQETTVASTSTTTSTSSPSTSTTNFLLKEDFDENGSNLESTTWFYDERDVVTSNDDALTENVEAETIVPVFHNEEIDMVIINETSNNNQEIKLLEDVQINHEGAEVPPPLVTDNTDSSTEFVSTLRPIPTYEFTDYPPPLPPSLSGYPGTPPQGKGPSLSHRSDASFAVGVAVGILACVIVAAACVTWCVCRKHWGRRNVYATMEAEEIPKAFTKPGPPIILPNELFSSTQTKVMSKSGHPLPQEVQHSTEAKTNVTEL